MNKEWQVTYHFVLRQLNGLRIVALQRIGVSGFLWNVGPFQRGERPERLACLNILSLQVCPLCERWIVWEEFTDLVRARKTQREQRWSLERKRVVLVER